MSINKVTVMKNANTRKKNLVKPIELSKINIVWKFLELPQNGGQFPPKYPKKVRVLNDTRRRIPKDSIIRPKCCLQIPTLSIYIR
jgi:hypothetical protein